MKSSVRLVVSGTVTKKIKKGGLTNKPQCAIIQTDKRQGEQTMKHIKREIRYIRYRICRDIYYADQCPKDCRKNYNNIGRNILCACGLGVGVLGFMVLAVVLA